MAQMSLAEVFAKKFTELGGEIVSGQAVQPTDTDMRPDLAARRNHNGVV